jgi:hypothetical protein
MIKTIKLYAFIKCLSTDEYETGQAVEEVLS